jgi:hypothetical protein
MFEGASRAASVHEALQLMPTADRNAFLATRDGMNLLLDSLKANWSKEAAQWAVKAHDAKRGGPNPNAAALLKVTPGELKAARAGFPVMEPLSWAAPTAMGHTTVLHHGLDGESFEKDLTKERQAQLFKAYVQDTFDTVKQRIGAMPPGSVSPQLKWAFSKVDDSATGLEWMIREIGAKQAFVVFAAQEDVVPSDISVTGGLLTIGGGVIGGGGAGAAAATFAAGATLEGAENVKDDGGVVAWVAKGFKWLMTNEGPMVAKPIRTELMQVLK